MDPARIGERVLVRSMQQPAGAADQFACITYGSECDGGFAQYCTAQSTEAYRIDSVLSDVELASFPCAYSTAENMLERAGLKAGERVLVTGASGGGLGGGAAGETPWCPCDCRLRCRKARRIEQLGANRVIERGHGLIAELGRDSVEVVVDLVAGRSGQSCPTCCAAAVAMRWRVRLADRWSSSMSVPCTSRT